MKCVKVESYFVEAGTDRPSPSWEGGLQVVVTIDRVLIPLSYETTGKMYTTLS
jgi:hypothetical protein